MSNAWDRLARPRHLQLVQGMDITFFRVFLPKILQILQEQENHAAFTVLDVGCGTGFLTRILAEHVYRIVGVDSSRVSTTIAEEHSRGRHNVHVEHLSMEHYAKDHQAQFDFAIAHMTLQVIENLDLALKSISICLKEDGGLLFSIPHPCFWALIKEEVGLDDYSYRVCSSHENSFRVGNDEVIQVPYFHRSLETYSSALSSAGFVIERMIEPFPDNELMKEYRRPWLYPGFLMVLCRKNRDVEV